MELFYKQRVLGVVAGMFLVSGLQAESFADKVKRIEEEKKAEISRILNEEKEYNHRMCLENKRIFEDTGECVDCYLVGANLVQAIQKLNKEQKKINLAGANLTGAVICGVSLKRANFENADLTGTSFNKSDLTRANLSGAKLAYTNFEQADLSCATLYKVSVEKLGLTLNLKETHIEGVKTSGGLSDITLRMLHRLNNMFSK